MNFLPEEVCAAWDEHEGPVVLTTVDASGMPNSIYATCVGLFEKNKIVIADNYFNKTRENILSGSKASVLFITSAGKAYQVKGALEYFKDGDVFAFMKCWNPEKHPGHAAVAIVPEEVYSGAKKLN